VAAAWSRVLTVNHVMGEVATETLSTKQGAAANSQRSTKPRPIFLSFDEQLIPNIKVVRAPVQLMSSFFNFNTIGCVDSNHID
jgi:hypothetical protein